MYMYIYTQPIALRTVCTYNVIILTHWIYLYIIHTKAEKIVPILLHVHVHYTHPLLQYIYFYTCMHTYILISFTCTCTYILSQ